MVVGEDAHEVECATCKNVTNVPEGGVRTSEVIAASVDSIRRERATLRNTSFDDAKNNAPTRRKAGGGGGKHNVST
jgi:hypothetical protein